MATSASSIKKRVSHLVEVDTDDIVNGAITSPKIAYEIATLAFGASDTSKTATITAGAVIFGYYVSAKTGTPGAKLLTLSIDGTTLTGTIDSAPGSGNGITYKVILIKP
jgi:hypothetical protein